MIRALRWVQDSPRPHNAALLRALAADPAFYLRALPAHVATTRSPTGTVKR